jgi:hypothetical protein
MKGKIVKVTSESPRFTFMNQEFQLWLETNKNTRFYVIDDFGDKVRLKGVYPLITKDFIKTLDN